jgi:hypothetical protein
VALFQLESSSNEEIEFEHVKFREQGCGCSKRRQREILRSPRKRPEIGNFFSFNCLQILFQKYILVQMEINF